MVHLRMQCAKGSKGSWWFVLAADLPCRAQKQGMSRREAPGPEPTRPERGSSIDWLHNK